MKRKQIPRERNQFVAAALFRKAGKMITSERRLRRVDKLMGS